MDDYKPWIQIQDFPSQGIVPRSFREFSSAISIAETACIRYPCDKASGFPYVKTSDFFITTRNGMKYGHGLSACIAGGLTVGQNRNRVLKTILKTCISDRGFIFEKRLKERLSDTELSLNADADLLGVGASTIGQYPREAYILNLNEYEYKKKAIVEDNLKKMAISLAEVSPDDEADYAGDPNKLHEYSKRIIKLIDDCGTIQKAV